MNVTLLISDAMTAVERCGASQELTNAIFLLAKAKEHVAAMEAQQFRLADDALEYANEANSLRDGMARLLLVGNRLARGEVSEVAWHAVVKEVTRAPICVLSSANQLPKE